MDEDKYLKRQMEYIVIDETTPVPEKVQKLLKAVMAWYKSKLSGGE